MKKYFGMFVVAASIASFAFADDLAVKHVVQKSVPASGIQRMVLEIQVAKVDIRNSTDGTLGVTGTISREYGDTKEMLDAQKMVDAVDLNFVVHGNVAVLERKYGKAASSRSARGHKTKFDLMITVPPGTAVEVRQKVGEVALDGDFGNIWVDVNVGEVSAKLPKASVKELSAHANIGEVNTNLGDRIVTKEGLFAGGTHYLNEGGRSDLHLEVSVGNIDIQLK